VDRVVEALSKAMFEGQLGPGSQLREERLSGQFQVSRSTVREAIRVLTMDGLVLRQPNRSVVVRHLTVAEVEDIFRARLFLEGACVREAATCPERALQELSAECRAYEGTVATSPPPAAAEAHVVFHANMVQTLTGSRWLAETERAMLRQVHLLQGQVRISGYELQEEIRAHRELCDSCCERRIEAALANLREGLNASLASAIRHSREAQELARSRGEDLLPEYFA
jgi:DNA-binding GntR family transcriptional regulator